MIKKIVTFFEDNVEKIILIIIGLLCSWLLITRVLLCPNVVKYNNINYSPGAIDEQIQQAMRNVKNNNRETPSLLPELLIPEKTNYEATMADPLKDINADIPPLVPPIKNIDTPNEIYRKPDIGKVTNVDIEHIRAVAYYPIENVTPSNPYQESICDLNDIDFVTVEAKYNIMKLYNEFYNSYFATVSREYADPCNQKPIFASVNLQRQQLNPDGSWSNWQDVPRAKVDINRNMLETINNSTGLRVGGLTLLKLQLDNKITQLELLQPDAYQIASPKEEWFPPKLHREFLSAQKKDDAAARREESTQASDRTNSDSTSRRGGRSDRTNLNTGTGTSSSATGTNRRGSRSRNTTTSNYPSTTTTDTRRGSGRTTTSKQDTTDNLSVTGQPETEVDKVYNDFESIVLTTETDLSKMSDPIVFWAHDDTVEPDNTYRYRIRLGVLNPVAKGKEEIIFWSDFSDETSSVKIPGKIYFFAKSVQEAAKTVNVSIYKLDLGYWYKNDSRAAQGEMIGDIVTLKSDDSRITDLEEDSKTINFNTGATMIDVTRTYEWSGDRTLNRVPYDDMMYSYDGSNIKHMRVTANPNSRTYIELQNYIKEKPQSLQSWGSSEMQLQQIRNNSLSRGYRN
jgi:hypothetical protein